jgi:hypothetical protein
MVDKAKIKDIVLWTVYTNVIDHPNVRYRHVVDLLVNKKCQNITFRDYFFLQRVFGCYGALFRSVSVNDVLNYANNIEFISNNEKILLLHNINLFCNESRILYSRNNFINMYKNKEVSFYEFKNNLVLEDI